MCGENLSFSFFSTSMAGSPPRVRGKRGENEQRGHLYGITPACAGKPKCGRQTAGLMWDYPRACGENGAERVALYGCKGSPPRMRGKPVHLYLERQRSGITPTHAGKTARSAWRFTAVRDHPRACGENQYTCIWNDNEAGSPPRMRGKRRGARGALRL